MWLMISALPHPSRGSPHPNSAVGTSRDEGMKACWLVFAASACLPSYALSMSSLSPPPRVLALGVAAIDYSAVVVKYPDPDAKIRTESLEVFGGGNGGNTITCCARLGLASSMLTKIGNDANGQLVIEGLRKDGVDTSFIVVSPRTPSAFTYVIVDRKGKTRTCIHTPMTEELLPDEVDASMLEGVDILHLDSRMTGAAIKLAELAIAAEVPIVLDAEKHRPGLSELLPLATYIITNRSFPMAYTGKQDRVEAMSALLDLGRARFVVSTMGEEGSLMVCREEPAHATTLGCSGLQVSSVEIRRNTVEVASLPIQTIHCGAASVPAEDIVDTTGAGDAYIGGIIYGIVNRLPTHDMMALASTVAAKKLQSPGARPGIPTLAELRSGQRA
ncbi:unnamed protein product [Chrysoparadoxa australica]